MIHSSPCWSHNRAGNQSWTGGLGSEFGPKRPASSTKSASTSTATLPTRRPPPQQRAPDRPNRAPAMIASEQPYKSSTLNRIDLLKLRQSKANKPIINGTGTPNGLAHYSPSSVDGRFVRRNVSSLGHYPMSANAGQQIYSPASIASPSEFLTLNRTQVLSGYGSSRQADPQQHYAATSVRSMPAHSPSRGQPRPMPPPPPPPSSVSRPKSRSGRESALGSLFGTIRRKTTGRWSANSSSTASTTTATATSAANNAHRQRSASSLSGLRNLGRANSNGYHHQHQQQEQPIYANSFLSSIPVRQEQDHKRQLEAEEIYAEGAHAIDSNSLPRLIEVELLQDPEQWAEGETRTLIEEESRNRADFRELQETLVNWINDELAEQRIIVKDLREDLYDGQVFCKLIERLQSVQLDIVEVTQNEQAQKYKLHTVLSAFNRILCLSSSYWSRSIQWSVNGIHQKNLVEIIRLLVVLARFYQAPIRLPQNVGVLASTYQKNPQNGQLTKRSHQEQLTHETGSEIASLEPNRTSSLWQHNGGNNDCLYATVKPRDAFDTLVDQAPNKLLVVTKTLVKFCNRHLDRINITAGQSLDTEQFSDGLLLVFLISSLEGYFVPLGQLFTTIKKKPKYQETSLDALPFIDANNNINIAGPTAGDFCTALEPTSFTNTQPIEKLHNVNLALQLIEEAGLSQIRQQVRAEDVVNGDLKAILRVLYALFSRYKHL